MQVPPTNFQFPRLAAASMCDRLRHFCKHLDPGADEEAARTMLQIRDGFRQHPAIMLSTEAARLLISQLFLRGSKVTWLPWLY